MTHEEVKNASTQGCLNPQIQRTQRVLLKLLLIWACGLFVITSCDSRGSVQTINSNAVYITGEACIIDMDTDRKLTSIASDMSSCLHRHAEYQEANP